MGSDDLRGRVGLRPPGRRPPLLEQRVAVPRPTPTSQLLPGAEMAVILDAGDHSLLWRACVWMWEREIKNKRERDHD